ncbi:MAG: ABC transporter permease, partial [Chloroflexi bacterium]|nr:ABC transporter permease [Chloroflexota bacterium]
MNEELIRTLNSIVANATPLVIASIGETVTERAGVVNLSLDGSIILSAMVGFVAALASGSPLVGVLAAMLVGGLIALIVAFGGITLRQDQVAVGFVLTLLAANLAQFLGQNYTRIPGPQILNTPLPVVEQIPVIGPVFFRQSIFVYISYVLVFGLWYWLFRTRPGLAHRAVGERPETAFARGTRVNALRYIYTGVGGALVGLAGAAYSLNVKAGWSTPPSMAGDGWIALAIVIFGGWHPFRVVLGAYLFAGLRVLATTTTRIAEKELRAFPHTLTTEQIRSPQALSTALNQYGLVFIYERTWGGKVIGVSPEYISTLADRVDSDTILIEA